MTERLRGLLSKSMSIATVTATNKIDKMNDLEKRSLLSELKACVAETENTLTDYAKECSLELIEHLTHTHEHRTAE